MSKYALVTGGSGGLGAAICKTLASSGYKIVFTYNSNRAKAERTLQELDGEGHQFYSLDVADTQAIESLRNSLVDDNIDIDLLVNCAGTTQFVAHQDLSGLTDDIIDKILSVNVRAPLAMVRAFQSSLDKKRGCIINITSIAAKTAMGSNIAYCASKAALENMTCSLARALAPNVRVLSVAPGLIDTEFVKGLDEEWRNTQEQSTPLQRLADVEEVAKAVLLAAEQLTFSTGTTISVDGGRPLNG
ncbi:SDR family oxidoreductase [Vibrio sp. S4M6]|uniref:SDR family NAD(P)-dependent oxidoreductase n=1 Tax=Vibrio sinus TaxID=2946865 RepID=UPI00202A93F6|nr:SDR family oxidoreductase [Vibrio sinus]